MYLRACVRIHQAVGSRGALVVTLNLSIRVVHHVLCSGALVAVG